MCIIPWYMFVSFHLCKIAYLLFINLHMDGLPLEELRALPFFHLIFLFLTLFTL